MIIDTLGGQSPDLRKTQETQGDPPSHLLRSDVKARHDKLVGLVEAMMTADSLWLTAHGPPITSPGGTTSDS